MRESKFMKSLFLLVLLLANAIVYAQIPTDGLIGYWPFNGNANDVSGNNNHGILECEYNNVQLTTDRFGNENSAYQFGGYYNKNWIRVPNNSTMHLDSQMTISFWYQQCEFTGMNGYGQYSTTDAHFSLFSKAGDGISAYPGIWVINNTNSQTGDLNICSSNCNGNPTTSTNYSICTEYHCFDTCEWMHYVTVIDDNVGKIYINGVLYLETIINHADFTLANSLDLYLGRMGCNGTIWYPYHGKLDDVAFYNRALTDEEIAQLFDNYYDTHFYDNQIIIENLIVNQACNGDDGSVQVFVNQENGPYQYALDQPSNYQSSNILENISSGLHRIYVKSECGLKDTIVDFTCQEIVFPDNIDSANCTFLPTGTEWGIEVGWSSESVVSDFNTPLVGDLDDDGYPELVCFSNDGQTYYDPRQVDKILVFDGLTKQIKATITLPEYVTAYDGAAYGLVRTSSRKGLIIVACYDYKLRAYDITSAVPNTPYWVSDVDYGSEYGDWAVNVSFADFNHDGYPEVFVRNKIYNAETGKLLATATGGTNTGSSYCHFTHVTHWKMSTPIAADVCNGPALELILGNEIYTVSITNLNGVSGNSITLEKQITPPNGILSDGNPQVADFNSDGYLDVFVSVRDTDGYYGTVYGYVWDVHNNTLSNLLAINTSFTGKSIPMISDIDNDGMLEVLIQSCVDGTDQKFQAYKYNPNTRVFSYMWGIPTDEDSYSNSITSFDFNQDGLLELMICDQSTVRIVNGSGISHITQNDTVPVYVMNSFYFPETTIMQYPIIADVDGDGNAEILSVGCEQLNVFESAVSPWAPTRKVWNQYMYNVTNINEDLTVPRYLFNNATPFTDPENVVRRPFNNFLQQATTIDQHGRPFYAVPDAEALSASIDIGGNNATVNVSYTNQGDNTLNAPYSITVFANSLGGEVVQTMTVNTPLAVGGTAQQSVTLPLSSLCQLDGVTSLVVAVNCSGGGIAQEGGQQPECDLTNNTAQVAVSLQSEPTYITQTVCEQYTWYGQTYTESGQYEITIPNSFGCDSTLVLNLTISDSYMQQEEVTVCDVYEWHGGMYTEGGDYTLEVENPDGCDSLFILHLNIGQSYELEITAESCDSYLWNGLEYTESGDYQQDLTTQWGCDSIVILHLSVLDSYTRVYDTAVCGSIEWEGGFYVESGQYENTYQSVEGCDSTLVLNLTVVSKPVAPIIGKTLIYPSTDIVSGIYSYHIDSTGLVPSEIRWDVDRDDWVVLPHGASCELVCTSPGRGELHAWTEKGSCDLDTTLVVYAVFFGVEDDNVPYIDIYPNPTRGNITVEGREITEIALLDVTGQNLFRKEYGREDRCLIDMSQYPCGIYLLEVHTTSGRVMKKVVVSK